MRDGARARKRELGQTNRPEPNEGTTGLLPDGYSGPGSNARVRPVSQ
jgi:hypothetical protein